MIVVIIVVYIVLVIYMTQYCNHCSHHDCRRNCGRGRRNCGRGRRHIDWLKGELGPRRPSPALAGVP